MSLEGKRVGFALTGSHCNLEPVIPILEELVKLGARVTPILSEAVAGRDTRFGPASHWYSTVREVVGTKPLTTIPEVEPVGPERLFDVLAICPCTGNTMAKLASAITDSVVTMASKAHLRNGRPLVIAVSTNDGLGLNARNLGVLLSTRHVYFVPFGQDNPKSKPNSIIADFARLPATIESALEGSQLQPLLIGRE